MNRRQFTRRAMFGLFGGAAAVTTTEVSPAPQGHCFPQKNRFRHKTGLGFYDFAWSGWKQQLGVGVCCGQWFALPYVDPRGPVWAQSSQKDRRPGFYSSTTGTNGLLPSMQYTFDLTYKEGHPLITDFSTHKQKAHSRQESFDRILKMIEDWNEEPPMQYYELDTDRMIKPGDPIPTRKVSLEGVR